MTHAAPTRLQGLTRAVRRPGFGQSIARTAGFNFASAAVAGLGGVVIARTLGPTVRGEYAAIIAWLGIVQMFGGMGQPAALCFYVARDPGRGRDYAATSRAMMLATGGLVLAIGMLLAQPLAHRRAGVAIGYEIAFGSSIISFVSASYTFSLQARDLHRWNVVRLSQPLLGFGAIIVLWRLGVLTLSTGVAAVAVTNFAQLVWAYGCCRRTGLAPGRTCARLVRPLAAYGTAQIAALTPATVNATLDQLVLSQTVPPADLGRYAIAVSLTSLPIPLVSAIGNVAFPHLAAQYAVTEATRRLQLRAVLGSASLAAAILVPLALVAYWLIPLVFGTGYRGAVPLLWILTPGAVFLACGQVVGDLLRGRNQPIVVAWAQGLAAAFTVALLIGLLPVLGVSAAAIASTVAYGFALAVMVRSLKRLPRHARGSGPLVPPAAVESPATQV